MGIDVETKGQPGSARNTESLDLSGLPASVIVELKGLVAALRDNLATDASRHREESADAWEQRLDTWVRQHPAREVVLDDSRESLYAGRGE